MNNLNEKISEKEEISEVENNEIFLENSNSEFFLNEMDTKIFKSRKSTNSPTELSSSQDSSSQESSVDILTKQIKKFYNFIKKFINLKSIIKIKKKALCFDLSDDDFKKKIDKIFSLDKIIR